MMGRGLLLVSLTLGTSAAWAQYPPAPEVTKDGMAVLLEDYASLPLSSITTGVYPPPINFAGQLARVNFLRSEPPDAPQSSSRFFVNDNNRNLYILDKTTRTFTPYINYEEVFPKFENDAASYAGGLVTFAFDPGYANNGKFYAVHTENPNRSGPAEPTNANLPGLDLSGGYTVTAAVNPPAGTVDRQAVLVEWRDTNRANSTFEGTAREILRVGFNTNIHPMGDLLFNPLAQPGDGDYGNLYVSVADGGAGQIAATRSIPQRLDALPGKIIRITPDLNLRPGDELSANGRYRIPTTGSDPNPFVSLSLAGLKKEIYAYGFRNQHRLSWDPVSNKLISDDIGLQSWEEVNIISKGANYGYSEREGIEQLFVGGTNDGKTGSQTTPPTPFPDPDSLTVAGIDGPVTPVYPVAEYSHRDGDAVSSGFVYRGSLMPALYGKYVFGDITTARLLYADLTDMIANDDGNRTSLAPVHELQVVFDRPDDNPDQGPVNRRLFDVVADEYARRGGDAPGSAVLPGGAPVTNGNDPDGIPYGGGRADIRLALGGDGEIYVLSKSDGMIRRLAAATAPALPTVTVAATDATATEAGATTGTFAVSRSGSTASALTVNYTVSGTATPASDYAALTGSVTIPAAAASATFPVTPVNDTAVEPNETVVVSLSPGGAYSVGAPGSATVTIVSDDVAQTGLRSPTANAADNGGDGNGFQSSPQNAHADDTLNAVDTNSGTDSSTSCTSGSKDKHRFYNYGLTFPAGISIRGIEVRLDARVDSGSSSPKMCVQLSWDGGTTWTSTKSTPTLATSMGTFTLGSSTDTWGRTWTTGNFADANFRVRVINVSSSPTRDFSLDWVAVNVHQSPSDTSPPTAPTNLTATPSTGTASLAWGASTDNVGIDHYNVHRSTTTNFTPTTANRIAQPAANSYTDSGLASGTYYYRVVAQDAAGNVSPSSNEASANVPAPPTSTGLVAAWSMNGAGTTIPDLSGNGNTGTLSGPTSAAGKYGNSLSFDGVNDWITVNDSASLDLVTGMTLEAWVYPTATGTTWRTILFKEQPGGNVYAEYANQNTNRPVGQVTIGGEKSATGTAAVPLNTWTHIATTYDGTNLRLYINALLVAATPVTGSLTNSSGVLRIGGNSIWPEWFAGRIDEVRVYNRARTQSEVQTDMNTALTP
jgi:concanavalin A-like lectin/glucanase superfamily protein/glucose/sorbosone dehydrogenase/Calx-beta domain-containing protein